MAYRYFAGLYRQCDAIHYPTQFLRDLYEGLYGPTNGYVISNGVHPDIHPVTAQKPAVFAATGALSAAKRAQTFVTAAFFLDTRAMLLSLLGAAVLNLSIALNHRRDWYTAQ